MIPGRGSSHFYTSAQCGGDGVKFKSIRRIGCSVKLESASATSERSSQPVSVPSDACCCNCPVGGVVSCSWDRALWLTWMQQNPNNTVYLSPVHDSKDGFHFFGSIVYLLRTVFVFPLFQLLFLITATMVTGTSNCLEVILLIYLDHAWKFLNVSL